MHGTPNAPETACTARKRKIFNKSDTAAGRKQKNLRKTGENLTKLSDYYRTSGEAVLFAVLKLSIPLSAGLIFTPPRA